MVATWQAVAKWPGSGHISGMVQASAASDTGSWVRPSGRSLYVHVPFCARTCDFCAFYQIQPHADDIRRYLSGVSAELALLPAGLEVETLFWGGGTPGLLAPRDLEELGRKLLGACTQPPSEWTVEIAPGSARPEKLRQLRSLGVNRISMGVQSFDPRLLDALGRQHTLEQVRRAYDWVREAGFESVNLDLIFGIPGQSLGEWEADLQEAVRCRPEHISTYCLTFEEDTALYLRLMRGEHRVDREAEAKYFEVADRILACAGFDHYEVSNFALPGHACRHNLLTWRMGWWAGIGPSAASQEDLWRGANPPDLNQWLEDLRGGGRALHERTHLSAQLLATDAVIFGLRMAEGIDWNALGPLLGGEARHAVSGLFQDLVDEGRAAWQNGRFRLTPQGLLVADAVGTRILELVEGPEAGS